MTKADFLWSLKKTLEIMNNDDYKELSINYFLCTILYKNNLHNEEEKEEFQEIFCKYKPNRTSLESLIKYSMHRHYKGGYAWWESPIELTHEDYLEVIDQKKSYLKDLIDHVETEDW